MRSTFSPGQVLYVHPTVRLISPGEVVVYRRGEYFVVHRVVAVDELGYKTRGDDNLLEDAEPILNAEVVGVVEAVEDWGKVRPIRGGKASLLKAQLRWLTTSLFDRIRPVLGAPYRWLKARRWVSKIWRPHFSIIQLQTPNGATVKYVVRGKTVATWQQAQARFICCRPYDLVIFPPEIPL